jgi:hypothetical protein
VHCSDGQPHLFAQSGHFVRKFGERDGAFADVNQHYHHKKLLQYRLGYLKNIVVVFGAGGGDFGQNPDIVLADYRNDCPHIEILPKKRLAFYEIYHYSNINPENCNEYSPQKSGVASSMNNIEKFFCKNYQNHGYYAIIIEYQTNNAGGR